MCRRTFLSVCMSVCPPVYLCVCVCVCVCVFLSVYLPASLSRFCLSISSSPPPLYVCVWGGGHHAVPAHNHVTVRRLNKQTDYEKGSRLDNIGEKYKIMLI